eukprot:GFKZ01014825.1.p2 GENE.GFKZ01014825.1~~GFKZ01014825.1.p2  ORF type:complete len:107 (+),score=3.53 GFKZ01014825.1:417-737(+)
MGSAWCWSQVQICSAKHGCVAGPGIDDESACGVLIYMQVLTALQCEWPNTVVDNRHCGVVCRVRSSGYMREEGMIAGVEASKCSKMLADVMVRKEDNRYCFQGEVR